MKKKSIEGRELQRFSPWLKRLLIMKMIVILILVVGLTTSYAKSDAQTTKLNLKLKSGTLKDVIEEVERQTDLSFMYDNSVFNVDRQITIDVENETVKSVVEKLISGENLKYEIVNRYIIITEKRSLPTNQQQKSVSGKVNDSTGSPLPGVTVLVKGSTIGVITDSDGNYSLSNVPSNASLQFSFVGMKTEEVVVSGKTTINMVLNDESIGLDEVIAIGYGKQKKATITGSIGSTDDKTIKRSAPTSLSNSLSGLLPGVTTLNRSGEPGENVSEIYIRGRSTTGDSNPLVVVDGIPDETGEWQRINNNEIEQVSVLKDASAAIYGARAANGVILITTKRGGISKPTFNYTYNQGIIQPTRLPEMANSWEFADYVNQYRETIQNLPALYSADEIKVMKDGTDQINYPNADWIGAIFKDFSTQSMHNLNVRGGTEKARYSMSGSYIHENSLVKNGLHEYSGYTVRSNIDVDITKNIKIGLDINGGIDDRIRPVIGGFGMEGSPLISPFFPNGLPSSLPR